MRQGDPISHYLFLIGVESFSAVLHYRISVGHFTYHPSCSKLQLYHLAFACDLFVLCGAFGPSFILIDQLLKDFHSYFGLKPNLAKSSIFFVGASEDLKSY